LELSSSITFNEGETTIILVREREFAMLSAQITQGRASKLSLVRLLQQPCQVRSFAAGNPFISLDAPFQDQPLRIADRKKALCAGEVTF
jgi:hypothetical protein